MPKGRGVGAKHDERRVQIADALLRIAAQRGLAGVNLRDVAQEAGVSVGRVQHYFGNKDELLHAAFEEVQGRGSARIQRLLGPDPAPREVLRAIAVDLIPADEQARDHLRVALAFTAQAAVQPEYAERLRDGYRELHELLALLLRNLGRPEHAAGPEAVAFLALAEGLGLYVLLDRQTAEEAVAIIDAELDRLLG
ncbi:TetR/AcrR family transcriptional regulator [Kribbella deserti]|uniref:TetR/AcrR family transcriptional regulator n=1 Tax=Kribbella deserti TaxID=1926257 RepID=A0ABV6QMC0_9ACTN